MERILPIQMVMVGKSAVTSLISSAFVSVLIRVSDVGVWKSDLYLWIFYIAIVMV